MKIDTFIGEVKGNAGIEEGHLPKPSLQSFLIEIDGIKNAIVWIKLNSGSCLRALLHLFQFGDRLTKLIGLVVLVTITPNPSIHPLG